MQRRQRLHPQRRRRQRHRFALRQRSVWSTVLVVYGWPFTWLEQRRVLTLLAPAEFTVVVPDLRGISDPDKPDDDYDKQNFARIFTARPALGLVTCGGRRYWHRDDGHAGLCHRLRDEVDPPPQRGHACRLRARADHGRHPWRLLALRLPHAGRRVSDTHPRTGSRLSGRHVEHHVERWFERRRPGRPPEHLYG